MIAWAGATMTVGVETSIYVLSRGRFDLFRAPLESRSSTVAGAVRVHLAEGEDVAAVVERARESAGDLPVGVLANTEAEAHEAVEAGADEAFVLEEPDERSVTTFVDRIRLRAKLRRMDERLSQDFAQAERLTALGTLVAGVGHEMNNPLAAITLTVDMAKEVLLPDLDAIWELKRKVQDGELPSAEDQAKLLRLLRADLIDARQMLDEIGSATQWVAQLVQDLRVFSRSHQVEPPIPVEADSVIEQALRLVRREVMGVTVIERDYEQGLPELIVPRNRLTQVLTNLLMNAAHSIREVNRPVHQIRVGARVDDQFMAISVSDTGSGIPEDSLDRIFDPFFTTKREGQGTGLGLSISRSILRQLGGDLVVSSVYGVGATFICLVPLPTEEQRRTASMRAFPLVQVPEETSELSVLLVDDDDRFLRAVSRVLMSRYKVLIARDGQEAIELLASGSHADVVITELDVPEPDGVALSAWLHAHWPQLAARTIIATGAQEQPRFREFLRNTHLTVLHKPFDKGALVRAIEQSAQWLSAGDRSVR